MQTSDKADFDKLLDKLCAAFDRPAAEKYAAYWEGLQSMSIIEFSRVVDFALSEEYPTRYPPDRQKRPSMPNVPTCWQIRKSFRARPEPKLTFAPKPPRRAADDHLVHFANRLLLRHVIWRGGIGIAELELAQAAKNRLVLEFATYVRERDEIATKGEFVRLFCAELRHCGSMPSIGRWEKLLEAPFSTNCFSAAAADGIDANGQLDLEAA